MRSVLFAAALVMEFGWIATGAASLALTDSYDFGASLLEQTGDLWTWAIPLRRIPHAIQAEVLLFALLVVTLGYLVALGVTTRARTWVTLKATILLMLVFALTLLVTPGLLSADLLHYVAYGRIVAVYGSNPYVGPSAPTAGEGILQWNNWPDQPSPYGPLWTWLSAALAWLTAGLPTLEQALSYRLLGLGAHVANCVLLWRIVPLLVPTSRPSSVVLAYAWNPLVLLEVIGSGHNDGLMLTFVLVAILLLASRVRWRAALSVLWLATLLKWIPALIVVYVGTVWMRALNGWRTRLTQALALLLAVAAVVVVLAFPWLTSPGLPVILANASEGGQRYVNALNDLATQYVAVRWVDPHGHDLVGAEAAIRSWIQLVMRVAFAVYLAFEVRALWIGRGDVQAALEASTRTLLVALLLVFTQMLDWYFVWPTTLGAALAWRGSVARAALVYAVLYPPIFYASHENLLTTPVVVPVLLLFAILPILIVQIGRGEIPGIIVPRDEGCHRLSARQS